MTNNSIDYITKKHFRSPANIAVTLVAAAIAAGAVWLAVISGMNPAVTVLAAFTALSAVFALIRVFSPGAGCTLLRVSISVIALAGFIAGLESFTLGYLLIRHSGTQEHLNSLLSHSGFTIALAPEITGRLLLAVSVLFYTASGCAFFCHRYLGAVRSCAAGTLKRSGLRVFPPLSAVLFFLYLIAGGIWLWLSSDWMACTVILSDTRWLLTAGIVVLLFLHLLLSGINARSFARRTFAFKVFEKTIMKVETNADGTVYVPIIEDVEPDTEERPISAKPAKVSEETLRGKPFISEFAASGSPGNASGEADIL